MEYDGIERRTKHWHLEKNVSVGHIVTTLAAVVSVFVWGAKMDNRVTLLEEKTMAIREQVRNDSERWRESMVEIKSALIRIENKLDTKADKR